MEKIYANSEEKYLKGVVLYAIQATGGNTVGLFYDAEGTKQAYESDYDWKDLFMKGLIRVVTVSNGTICNPIGINDPNQIVTTISLDISGLVGGARFFADEENESSDEGHHGGVK